MRPALPLALPVVLLAIAGAAPAQDKWETVDSKEGQFTVQLPARPTINQSKVKKGPGGSVKTVAVGCAGEGGLYLAYKIVLPTAIVKGTEDAELDAERDGFAKDWNGTVTGERKIRAGAIVGRDFTVRGTPPKGKGTVTIRIREYLAGNAVYLVAVVSLPNRELPDDTGRFLGSLAIGEKRARAAGSPEAEQKGTDVPGWGLAIDPLGMGKLTTGKDRLGFTVTAVPFDQLGPKPILSAPRVVQEVDGDFVVTVKVTGEFRPGGVSTNPKTVPFNGAGIIVYSDAENYIRLERAAVARGGRTVTYVNFEELEGGTAGAAHNEGMKGGDCWVRMERKGSRIHGAISFDGATWKQLRPIQTVWPSKLKVGLLATSSSPAPFTGAFEEFELKTRVD